MSETKRDPVAVWEHLVSEEGVKLLADSETCDEKDVASVARLRKQYDADSVAAALQLHMARRAATGKFPAIAETIIADSVGVQQASSQLVADFKAARFAELGKPVVDLCSGIGGDTISLHRAVGVTCAFDSDPLRSWMTQRNAGCHVSTADVTALEFADEVFHFDPARRDGHRRLNRLSDYQPGPAFLVELLRRCPTGATKLGPGVDLDELYDVLDACDTDVELQFICEHGTLVQAVLWTGELAREARSAVLLPSGEQLAGEPDVPPMAELGAYLYEPDAAVERAELLHLLCDEHDLGELHPGLGLLTGDAKVDSPWLTRFEVLAELPWRVGHIKRWLKQHNAGIVEVKTRGKAVDANAAQRQLRGDGSEAYCVFGLRLSRKVIAVVTRR